MLTDPNKDSFAAASLPPTGEENSEIDLSSCPTTFFGAKVCSVKIKVAVRLSCRQSCGFRILFFYV